MIRKNLLNFLLILASGMTLLSLHSCASDPTPSSPSAPAPTHTFTLTSTTSDTPTITPTETPTDTPTNSPTITPSYTPTNSPTITETPTCTNSPTNSPTPTITRTPTDSPTPTLTSTPTVTFTAVYPYQRTIASGALYCCSTGIALTSSGAAVTIMVGNGNVLNMDLFTGTSTGSLTHTPITLAKPGNPQGVAWSSYNSNFYVVVGESGTGDYIQRFTASGGNPGAGPVTYASATSIPSYIAVAANGHFFVADQGTPNTVQEYDDLGNPIGSPWGSYSIIRSLAYDAVNNMLALTQSTGSYPNLVRLNLDGSSPTTLTNPAIPTNTWAVGFDTPGNLFLATGNGASGGYAMRKYTNAVSFLAQFGPAGSGGGQLYQPDGFAIDGQGYVYVINPTVNSNIVEYAPY